MKQLVSADGVTGYLRDGYTVSKVTLATGASSTLVTDIKFNDIMLGGNDVLYGCTDYKIYSIDTTTGVVSITVYIGGESMVYKDTDEMYLVSWNSLILVDYVLDTWTYIRNDI